MPSVLDLIKEKSTDLNDIARNEGKKSLVTDPKAEKIVKLSDESLTEKQKEVIKTKKNELVDNFADKFDIESPRQKRKKELQEIILKKLGVGQSSSDGSVYLESEVDGKERHPHGETHFDSAEERIDSIRSAIPRMVNGAFENLYSYYLWESFRPKDRDESLFVSPSHVEHHPDGVLLMELVIPNSSVDLICAQRASIKEVVENACNRALDDKVNYSIIGNFRDNVENPIKIIPAHKEKKGVILSDIIVPRTSYPVLGAKSNPTRLED